MCYAKGHLTLHLNKQRTKLRHFIIRKCKHLRHFYTHARMFNKKSETYQTSIHTIKGRFKKKRVKNILFIGNLSFLFFLNLYLKHPLELFMTQVQFLLMGQLLVSSKLNGKLGVHSVHLARIPHLTFRIHQSWAQHKQITIPRPIYIGVA